MKLLEGKVAFVTGATRGIGWATARMFAEHGATLVVNGRDEAQLAARVTELKEMGAKALAVPGDVAGPTAVSTFYPAIFKAFGRLDVFVNNAGIMKEALLGMVSADLTEELLRVNLSAPILHLQAAARLMQRRPEGGSIINLSSIQGTNGSAGYSVYSATKAGIIGLTKTAARELAPKQVRVNAVAPGIIETDMTKGIPAPRMEELKARIGMGRFGSAEDVAKVITFLASDLSSYVTGQLLGIDGGLVL